MPEDLDASFVARRRLEVPAEKVAFANLRYTDEEGKRRKFIFTWLEDTHMRQYAMRDFYPENCPERVFNTWRWERVLEKPRPSS